MTPHHIPLPKPVLAIISACLWAIHPCSAQDSAPILSKTLNNPAPATRALFGSAVAGMGSDRILVGASGGMEAYLMSTNGDVLATFRDPDQGYGFGSALAAVGNRHVIVGNYNHYVGVAEEQHGRAYLYDDAGSLLKILDNPSPTTAGAFGWAVASLGHDKFVVGAGPDPNGSTPIGGRVFIYAQDGTLLNTIENPDPDVFGSFGFAVATVGADRVIVGAAGNGKAYLFDAGGQLLTTFLAPDPEDPVSFGVSVAAVGSDKIAIGGNAFGKAFLFDHGGTLLTTFLDPDFTDPSEFGYSLSAVGDSRVIIGSYRNGVNQAGAAYLFHVDGTLLATFENPTPQAADWFGWAVAGFGPDRCLVGGVWDNTGAEDSGASYLFDLPYPALAIDVVGTTASLAWTTVDPGLILQQSDRLDAPGPWIDGPEAVLSNGPIRTVQQERSVPNRFFRLRRR